MSAAAGPTARESRELFASGGGPHTTARTIALSLTLGALACNGGTPHSSDAGAAGNGACLSAVALDCQPAFEPTYPMIFEHLLIKTCGAPSTGTSCHGPSGAMAGLVLSDLEQSYQLLLGQVGGRARVLPGNPECSLIEQRLESQNANFRMPPGSMQLPESVRCAVRQWIANGALQQ
jgi:hypothetical protein